MKIERKGGSEIHGNTPRESHERVIDIHLISFFFHAYANILSSD